MGVDQGNSRALTEFVSPLLKGAGQSLIRVIFFVKSTGLLRPSPRERMTSIEELRDSRLRFSISSRMTNGIANGVVSRFERSKPLRLSPDEVADQWGV